MQTVMRLLIADDHEVVRTGLCRLLTRAGWEVIAEAKDGPEAVKLANELHPDVAVLDVSMPGLSGLDVARLIHRDSPLTRVLIVTMHESDQLVAEALEAGVEGFVLKTDAGQDLVSAVEALANHKTYFTADVAKVILDRHFLKRAPNAPSAEADESRIRLTPRQREIVQLLAQGKSSKEIAPILGVSSKTIETHRANIMSRLSLHSISDLTRYAIRNQIVRL